MNKLFDKDDVNFFKIVAATAVVTIALAVLVLQETKMDRYKAEQRVATLAGLTLVLIVAALYLIPWLLPLFYDMPEGTTLPYYALLLAIEMAPHTRIRGEPNRERYEYDG